MNGSTVVGETEFPAWEEEKRSGKAREEGRKNGEGNSTLRSLEQLMLTVNRENRAVTGLHTVSIVLSTEDDETRETPPGPTLLLCFNASVFP